VAVPRRSSRSRFTLILLILSSITLLTLDYRGFAPIDAAKSGVLSVFAPVGDATSNLFRPVGDAWSGAFDSADLKRDNEDLRRRNEELEGKATQNQSAQQELEALKKQLDLPYIGEIPTVRASVTSGSLSNFDNTVTIDKGSGAGIDKGMPVVTGAGLVGVIASKPSDGRAVVKLISDRSFQVGVSIPNKQGRGIVAGQGDEYRVKASQFDLSATIAENDVLETSGAQRSTFPRGIPVGTVTSVSTDEATQQKTADVRLLANLTDLTYVTILRYTPKQE
jgi:rod shape-determining protein MreC